MHGSSAGRGRPVSEARLSEVLLRSGGVPPTWRCDAVARGTVLLLKAGVNEVCFLAVCSVGGASSRLVCLICEGLVMHEHAAA
jgi:hypothetical protein